MTPFLELPQAAQRFLRQLQKANFRESQPHVIADAGSDIGLSGADLDGAVDAAFVGQWIVKGPTSPKPDVMLTSDGFSYLASLPEDQR